jgi:hypothetical protein
VPSSGWVLASSGDDYGGGSFILVFQVEELDAQGAAAGGSYGFGVDADDLTKLAEHMNPGTAFPNGESLKNKSGKVACFSDPETDRQLTSNPPQFTSEKTTFCTADMARVYPIRLPFT